MPVVAPVIKIQPWRTISRPTSSDSLAVPGVQQSIAAAPETAILNFGFISNESFFAIFVVEYHLWIILAYLAKNQKPRPLSPTENTRLKNMVKEKTLL
jgi:hypothetical protein